MFSTQPTHFNTGCADVRNVYDVVAMMNVHEMSRPAKRARIAVGMPVTLSTNTSNKKSVRFSDKPLVVDRLESQRTEEEIVSTWYTKQEYEAIWNDVMGIVNLVKNTNVDVQHVAACLDPDIFCLRGIEGLMLETSANSDSSRRLRKSLFAVLVLHEQETQRMNCISDPISLAAISEEGSKESTDEAIHLAALDAIEAYVDAAIDAEA